jgi:hypothetical protein
MNEPKENCRYVVHFEDGFRKEKFKKYLVTRSSLNLLSQGFHLTYEGEKYILRDVSLILADKRGGKSKDLIEIVQIHAYFQSDSKK